MALKSAGRCVTKVKSSVHCTHHAQRMVLYTSALVEAHDATGAVVRLEPLLTLSVGEVRRISMGHYMYEGRDA